MYILGMDCIVSRQLALFVAFVLFSGVGVVSRASAQSFMLLSSPAGIQGERVYGLSADGRVAAGENMQSPGGGFFWTAAQGKQPFGFESPLAVRAYGLSGDGTTAVGESGIIGQTQNQAFRYRAGSGLENIGRLSGYTRARALGASFDGEIVVGRSEAGGIGDIGQAFRWTSTTGMVGLGFLQPGQFYSEATAISRDGSTIVGNVRQTSGWNQAFVWREGMGMVGLPGLSTTNSGRAFGVNDNGTLIVGDSGDIRTATMWVNGVPMTLGAVPGFIRSQANGVNDTGTVVVGSLQGGTSTAAIWTPNRGMEPLSAYLTHYGIAVPAGINLLTATSVSADGMTIAGYTGIPGAGVQGWVVTIPAPSGAVCVGFGTLGLALRRRRRCP